MKWFKHSVDSHDDPDISDAEDEFGDAGYNVFFKVLEIYGREFSSIDEDGFLDLSQGFLRRKLRKSSTKVQLILNFYQEKNRIVVKVDGKRIQIKIPQFIEIASNWTKRKTNDKDKDLCSTSVVPTAIELEEEEEEEEEVKIKIPPRPPCPFQKIVEIYHSTLPELPRVKSIEGFKNNMRARWNSNKEYQDISWWEKFFKGVGESDFLMGRKTDFVVSLGWMVGPKNFSKILNGQYVNREQEDSWKRDFLK